MQDPPRKTPTPEGFTLSPNPARAHRGVVARWEPVPGCTWYRIRRNGEEVWAGEATKAHLQAIAGHHTVSAQNSHGYGPESDPVELRILPDPERPPPRRDDDLATEMLALYRFAQDAMLRFRWPVAESDPRWKLARTFLHEAIGVFLKSGRRFDPGRIEETGAELRRLIAKLVQEYHEYLTARAAGDAALRQAQRHADAGALWERILTSLPRLDGVVLFMRLEGAGVETIAANLGLAGDEVRRLLRSALRHIDEHFGDEVRGLFDDEEDQP